MPDKNAATGRSSTLYTDTQNPASRQALIWQKGMPDEAAIMARLGEVPTAKWFTGWEEDIEQSVRSYVSAAQKASAVPVLVAYSIPKRDAGKYSSGGLPDAASYGSWITGFGAGIGDRQAIVILEPDALALLEQLPADVESARYLILHSAAESLCKDAPNTALYLDAGHPDWQSAAAMAERISQVGSVNIPGFSLNVSNFCTIEDCLAYGTALSELLGGKHFVIDTSRNGNGPDPDGAWCNPGGRALGQLPTFETGHQQCDAYLWIKVPGESDGTGGPPIGRTIPPKAGEWWPEYALELARSAGWSNLQTNGRKACYNQ